MDSLRSVDGNDDDAGDDAPGIEAPPAIGTDERRMQVRAYNYWVSMLAGRAYPSLDDLDPAASADFGPHGVLLDFSVDPLCPTIAYLGAKLRDECSNDVIHSVADVPAGSLLSRLTDHYEQIIANRAPIGFEAEFVNLRGHHALYRGILMPFSSDDVTINFIYGVINWKEVADDEIVARIEAEVREALTPLAAPALVTWADGPSRVPYDDVLPDRPRRRDTGAMPSPARLAIEAGLADRLVEAREGAVRACHGADRPALNHALALAYEFAIASEALPDDFASLCTAAGIFPNEHHPMLSVAELVFGGDDAELIDDYAAALAYGRQLELAPGGFAMLLDESPRGFEAAAEAYRADFSAPAAPQPSAEDLAREALRTAPAAAHLDLDGVTDEFVLLVGRREPDGSYAVVAALPEDQALTDHALRSLR